MKVLAKESDSILKLYFSGRLDSNSAEKASLEIDHHIQSQAQKILLNLQELEYISSTGLRLLLKIMKSRQPDGRVVICCVSEKIKEVLRISGFNTLIPLRKNEKYAMEYLNS